MELLAHQQQVVLGVPGPSWQHQPLSHRAEALRARAGPLRHPQLGHQHHRLHLHERAVQERVREPLQSNLMLQKR